MCCWREKQHRKLRRELYSFFDTSITAKRAQHANATYRNIVGHNMLRSFDHRVATCWVLLAQVWKWSNLSQQHPTCRNTVAKRTQHVVPSNVAISRVGMLRSFGRGLRLLLRSRSANRSIRWMRIINTLMYFQ